jgi:hypothetical protein
MQDSGARHSGCFIGLQRVESAYSGAFAWPDVWVWESGEALTYTSWGVFNPYEREEQTGWSEDVGILNAPEIECGCVAENVNKRWQIGAGLVQVIFTVAFANLPRPASDGAYLTWIYFNVTIAVNLCYVVGVVGRLCARSFF